MRRLPRILLNAATAVSLVLCVSTVVMWVRSYWVCDVVIHVHGRIEHRFDDWLSIERGRVLASGPTSHHQLPARPPEFLRLA